jgi:hypothetical protein
MKNKIINTPNTKNSFAGYFADNIILFILFVYDMYIMLASLHIIN